MTKNDIAEFQQMRAEMENLLAQMRAKLRKYQSSSTAHHSVVEMQQENINTFAAFLVAAYDITAALITENEALTAEIKMQITDNFKLRQQLAKTLQTIEEFNNIIV